MQDADSALRAVPGASAAPNLQKKLPDEIKFSPSISTFAPPSAVPSAGEIAICIRRYVRCPAREPDEAALVCPVPAGVAVLPALAPAVASQRTARVLIHKVEHNW